MEPEVERDESDLEERDPSEEDHAIFERDQEDNVSLEEWDRPIDEDTGEPIGDDELLFQDQDRDYKELDFTQSREDEVLPPGEQEWEDL